MMKEGEEKLPSVEKYRLRVQSKYAPEECQNAQDLDLRNEPRIMWELQLELKHTCRKVKQSQHQPMSDFSGLGQCYHQSYSQNMQSKFGNLAVSQIGLQTDAVRIDVKIADRLTHGRRIGGEH